MDHGVHLDLTERVGLITQIILTTMIFPFLLNLLVILVVKKTPRLQSKSNILLACLAATDAFIGLIAQPSSILVNYLVNWNEESGHKSSTVLPRWSSVSRYYQFIASSYAGNFRKACSDQVYHPLPLPNHRNLVITWCQVALSSLLFPTRFCTAKRFAIRNESRLNK